MRDSRTLLMIAVLTGVMAVGCAHKQRIEGEEVPTLPQSNETIAPPPAAPEAEAPPAVPTEAPTPVPTPVPTVEAAAPPPVVETENPSSKYIVVTGDTLWGISGMEITYKDNFLWPLIFKANRDQIKDPDLIFPRQDLRVDRNPTQEERNHSKQMAQLTPKFVPHSSPRSTLPIDYF